MPRPSRVGQRRSINGVGVSIYKGAFLKRVYVRVQYVCVSAADKKRIAAAAHTFVVVPGRSVVGRACCCYLPGISELRLLLHCYYSKCCFLLLCVVLLDYQYDERCCCCYSLILLQAISAKIHVSLHIRSTRG